MEAAAAVGLGARSKDPGLAALVPNVDKSKRTACEVNGWRATPRVVGKALVPLGEALCRGGPEAGHRFQGKPQGAIAPLGAEVSSSQ